MSKVLAMLFLGLVIAQTSFANPNQNPTRISFACTEADNINSVRDIFTRVIGGYDVKRVENNGLILGSFSLQDSEIVILPLPGLGSFEFKAKKLDGTLVDIMVSGAGSKMMIHSKAIMVDKKTLSCWD